LANLDILILLANLLFFANKQNKNHCAGSKVAGQTGQIQAVVQKQRETQKQGDRGVGGKSERRITSPSAGLGKRSVVRGAVRDPQKGTDEVVRNTIQRDALTDAWGQDENTG